MSKTVSFVILIVLVGLVLACAVSAPEILSDKNSFMKNFVGPEFLGVLGVISRYHACVFRPIAS